MVIDFDEKKKIGNKKICYLVKPFRCILKRGCACVSRNHSKTVSSTMPSVKKKEKKNTVSTTNRFGYFTLILTFN